MSFLSRASAVRVARAVAQRRVATAGRTSATLVAARAVAVAGPSSAGAACAGARRHATNWVRNFLQRDPKKGERAQEVDEKQLGYVPVPTPDGVPLRNPSSLRPPYAPKRFPVPGEEDKDTAQRQLEMRLGAGVEKMDLHPYCRIDEHGNPMPRHLLPGFPKSRKLVQEYDVVVIGAGAGGLAVAQKLGGAGMTDVDLKLNDEGNVHLPLNERRFDYKTLIIEPSATHYYQPMWTLVGGGKRDLEESTKSNWDYVYGMRHKAHMLQTSVVELLPHENAVITADGRKVVYKQLVIASGLEVKVDKVKGLRDALGRAGVSSNYVYPYPERTWDFVRFFPGGDAIFTMPSGSIKCAGAPQKIMYLAEDFWRRHVGRDLCNIKFVSGQGKLFGVPHYEKTLQEQCREKGIKDLHFGLNLIEVKPREKEAVFERVIASAAGSVGDRVTMPYTFLHVTPPQGPYDFIASSVLADQNGWVDVNKETLQHNRFPNVFAVGDCSSAPTSKTAAAAGAQASIVAENLIRFRERRPLSAKYDGYTACPFTLGNDTAMFAEFDYTGTPRETFPVDGSRPSKLLYHIKEEWFPHVYWDRLLEGVHDMDTYRRWFQPLRSVFGAGAPPAPAAAQK